MADVLVNIKGNTQQATAAINQTTDAVDNLNDAAGKAASGVNDLEASLKKQEANIKIIDGAVNLLGGSVEVAVGALGLLGVDEGIIEDFEKTALSAIAFADGGKRALDGVKSLNEGLSNFGGIAGVARKAQLALNSAVLSNPYVLAAAAVAALAAALVIYATRETEAEKATKLALETSKLRLQNLEDSEARVLSFARAQGIAAEEVLAFEQASVKARIAEIDRALSLEQDAEEYKRLSEEQRKLLDKEVELGLAAGKIKEDARQKEIADNKKANETRLKDNQVAADKQKLADEKAADEEKKASEERFNAEQSYYDSVNNLLQTEEERRILSVAKQYDDLIEQAAQFGADTTALEQARVNAIQEVIDQADAEKLAKQQKTDKETREQAESTAEALKNAQLTLLDTSAQAIGALSNLFKEGTAAYKVAALAEIAIGTATGFISALDIAQKSAKATGPAAAFAFPIFYASQIAAVLGAVASAKQVLATTPGGGGNIPNAKPSGGGSPSFTGPGATPLGGGFQTGPGVPTVTTPEGPIRAYVVSGDVTNAQVADGQIRRRRSLGPG